MLTKRQVLIKYGLNFKAFEILMQEGFLCPCFIKEVSYVIG